MIRFETALKMTAAWVAVSAIVACSKDDSTKKDDAKNHEPVEASVPFPEPEPDDCFMATDAGTRPHNCEGLNFEISVPDECLTHACGLITDVHGFGMNAELMNIHTHMREMAGEKGYIVLQPSAPGAVLASAWSPSNDSQVYALMQHVINVWHVDPKRIHFDGYSMGAWMTWRFICAHSDILASAAPIAGGLQPNSSCPFTPGTTADGTLTIPEKQIPIFYTHGRNDGLVNFSQAIAERDALLAAWYPGAEPEVVATDSDYEWDRYTDGKGGIFEFVQHDWACNFSLPLGGNSIALRGHCFPGSNQFLGCGRDTNGMLDGGLVYPFKWAETVLQFFIDHPKKD